MWQPRFDRTWALGALVAVLAGAAMVLGGGLHPRWPFPWLAPLPVVLFSLRHGWRSTTVVAFAGWLLGGLSLWTFLRRGLEVPVVPALLVLVIPALAFAVAVALVRALARRQAVALAALSLPAAWVSFEFLLASTSPNGTAFSLAYSQMGLLPVVQIASLAGLWAISFLVFLVPTALALLIAHRRSLGAWVVASAAVALAGLALAFGVLRLRPPEVEPLAVRVGLAASDAPPFRFPETPAATAAAVDAYARQASALAAQGARVIVLPEKIAAVQEDGLSGSVAPLRGVAQAQQTTIVVGLTLLGSAGKRNVAAVLFPDGKVALYEKHHLVPGFESSFRPGRSLLTLQVAGATAGVAVCKDLDFPPLSRRYAARNVQLLLAPAWDFGADAWLHSRMAILRGIEDGFTLVRSARDGRLTVTDDRGRVFAEESSAAAGFTRLAPLAPLPDGNTFYGRHGDWFAWLALALCAVCGLRLALPPRRGAAAVTPPPT